MRRPFASRRLGTEAPAFPVPPDALGRGFLFSQARALLPKALDRLRYFRSGGGSIFRTAAHFRVCLKYRKSGAGWSFLVGINWPSALSM